MNELNSLVQEAFSILTPGKLTLGQAHQMLDILKRYKITDGNLTEKQLLRLREFITLAKS